MEPSKLNIGHSSRLGYDECYYKDKLSQSVAPLSYRLDTNWRDNCNQCLSTFGPRPSLKSGVSRTSAQTFVDVESILTNRNIRKTKCKNDGSNHIDVTKYGLEHNAICTDYLNPFSSRLSYPAANYRDVAINRFYDLDRNPQANIFYDFAVNTKLEARDNFVFDIPRQWENQMEPTPVSNSKPRCVVTKHCTK